MDVAGCAWALQETHPLTSGLCVGTPTAQLPACHYPEYLARGSVTRVKILGGALEHPTFLLQTETRGMRYMFCREESPPPSTPGSSQVERGLSCQSVQWTD